MKITAKAQKIADNLLARLIANGWVKIPPGWKVVPTTPTPQQILAGARNTGGLADQYRAMVDAAPGVFDGVAPR